MTFKDDNGNDSLKLILDENSSVLEKYLIFGYNYLLSVLLIFYNDSCNGKPGTNMNAKLCIALFSSLVCKIFC